MGIRYNDDDYDGPDTYGRGHECVAVEYGCCVCECHELEDCGCDCCRYNSMEALDD